MKTLCARRRFSAVALAGFLLALKASGQALAARNLHLSVQDRVAIEELLYKYCHYIDNRLGEAWAATFTPDGKLDFPGTTVQGHDQLVAFGSRPVVDTIRNHFVGNILLVQTAPGHVHARSMVLTSVRDVKADAPPTFEGIGIYDDQIVKTDAGWRFFSRHADKTIPVSPDFLPESNHEAKRAEPR